MDWVSILIGAAIGGGLSWFITWAYYRKSLQQQEQLRQVDAAERAAQRAADAERRARDSERAVLYKNRESSYNEHQAKPDRRWDLTVNSNGTLTLVNRRKAISGFFEIMLHSPDAVGTREPVVRHSALGERGSLTFPLPGGINEVDGIFVQTYEGLGYPEQEIVPIHPKYTMADFRDPRISPQ
ncbi:MULTISPECIES: hypothetical protein [Corynebacterium]|uniref:Uncharacterized protein n=1 Tax=Corynebacterium gallinarum TaxID=2762214 RepID=A0A8I0LBR5_9CORY|nr:MULTISPECIES: hypothetical protein [Corynebacterium]MBD8029551.1 hypothetical protein [Corynebacterium gallinarum]